jgi:Cu2+-exporting ATPase
MDKCDHCLLEFPESRAVIDKIRGERKVFCCHGCRGIYRFINKEGLTDFYSKRTRSWAPGPPEAVDIDSGAFSSALRKVGDLLEVDIILEGIRCASCVWLVEKVLLRTEGITYARVNYATHKARIRWNPEQTDLQDIINRIRATGYTPKPFEAESHEEHFRAVKKDLLIRFGTAAFFTMQLMLFSIALYAGYFQGIGDRTRGAFQILSLVLATPVVFYAGWPFFKGASRGIRAGSLNMDVLIATGASAAYCYSIYQITAGGEVYFDTAAMIITFILLGRLIETGAKGRASEVISRLLSLSPKEANKVIQSKEQRAKNTDRIPLAPPLEKGGEQIERVPVSSIKTGDLLQIVPRENIPFDGIVSEGASEIDESMLTGEAKPVSKTAGSEVFSGTRNLYGSFVFQVTRTGRDTVLAHIIKTVEDAQTRQAPVQKIADRLAGVFVPLVLSLSILTAAGWLLSGSPLTVSVMNAVAVLVIACPCALGLATPLAILTGTTRAASKGILVKGGDIIERSRAIEVVILDKTGTITEGKPRLASYRGIGMDDYEALHIATSLERLSEHSIAKAITEKDNREAISVSGFAAVPGKGIRGTINGKPVKIGNADFAGAKGQAASMQTGLRSPGNRGSTVVYLSYDDKPAGVFMISDSIRKETAEAVKILQKADIQVLMITGDHRDAALHTAAEAGLKGEAVMAGMSPVDKAETIKNLQKEGKGVMMVGDGINDAPALVQADVGVAMGRATDIALESADMVLMQSNLLLLPEALEISKKIYAVIRQNLFLAFIYNMIALPLAVGGVLQPIFAALAMTLSSLSVVGNSMKLKKA